MVKLFMGAISSFLWLPCSLNLGFLWNMGSFLGVLFSIQLFSGLVLSCFYSNNYMESFFNVLSFHRDLDLGFFFRSVHVVGSSMLFLFLFLHMARGFYFYSSFKKKTWMSGLLVFILFNVVAFFGYILPWGLMSYWAVTVVSNVFVVLPFLDSSFLYLFLGGFCVSGSSLIRFFSFHFMLSFVLVVFVLFHIFILHFEISSNCLSVSFKGKKIIFFYYFLSDLVFWIFVCFVFFMGVVIWPFLMLHWVNFNLANPLTTPLHIAPEWYFLWAYAVLRAIPDKFSGLMLVIFIVVILFILPFLKVNSLGKSYFNKFIFIFFFFMLMILGSLPPEEPFTSMILVSYLIMLFMLMFV